jgi:hypothetical protein
MVSQVSNTTPLTVLQTVPDDEAGWRFVAVDLENQSTLITSWPVARGDWQQILNGVGRGSVSLPAGDSILSEILSNDPSDRRAVLVRAYMDDVFRYAFFLEDRKDRYSDDGGRLVKFHGRGMEAVAGDMKVRPFDHPVSPSRQKAWQYGSVDNLLDNADLSDVAGIVNPSGADGNDDAGVVNGWTKHGDVDSAISVLDPVEAFTGDYYIEIDTSLHHAGIEQSVACEPGRVVHLQAVIKEPLALGQRYTLSVSGASDMAATATFPNNFTFQDAVLAELGNVASTGTGCPGGASDGTWQVLDVEVTTGSEQTSLVVSVQNDHHPSCGDLDGSYPAFRLGDITIEGWGIGLEPFTPFEVANHDTDSFQRVTDIAPPGGTYSMQLNPTGADAGADQIVDVNPNGHYRSTVQVWTTGFIAGDTVTLELLQLDDTVLATVTAPYADGVWTQFDIATDIPSTIEQARYRVYYSGSNDPAVLNLANFAVRPGVDAATPGLILIDLLAPIQARGAVDFLVFNFDASLDSAGQAWLTTIAIEINPGSSILDVLERFVALGYEWQIAPVNYAEGGDTGMELYVWNTRALDPDSGAGVDWTNTLDAPVILPGEGVSTGQQRDQTRRPNVVFVQGKDGVWTEVMQEPFLGSGGYDETIGRIEAHIDVADVSNPTTLAQMGQAFLDDEKNREHGFRLTFQRATVLRPYRDFGVGDSLFVDLPPSRPDPDREDPRRVRSIGVAAAGEGTGVKYVVDFDRVVRDDEASLLAVVAQLAEQAPTDTQSAGSGSVTASGSQVVVVGGTVDPHSHSMSDLSGKTLSGDVSGQVDALITVDKVKGQPVSAAIPTITRTADPHPVAWVRDRDSLTWVPTELLDRDEGFWNGTFLEHVRTVISEAGGVVTLAIDATGGGDLTMRFTDGHTTFDTTPAAEIELTVGTDSVPQMNYIFIPQSTKVLTKSTSGFPTTVEHIRVVALYVQSAANVQSRGGTIIHQIWNDEAAHPSGQGHGAKTWERMRVNPAAFFSGFDGVGTTDYLTIVGSTVDFKVSSGVVYQMHDHLVDAHDTSVGEAILVKNWSGDPFHQITNLFDIVDLSDGTSIGNNKWIKLVFWGVASGGDFHPYVINLPSGVYNTQAAAEADLNGFADFDIPREFILDSTTGFLINATIVQVQASTWTFGSTQELRGLSPGVAATGGATAGISQFSDSIFNVFNNADSTKVVALDVSGVATGVTRTLVVPDADGTIALISDVALMLPLLGGTMGGVINVDGNSITGIRTLLGKSDGSMSVRPGTGRTLDLKDDTGLIRLRVQANANGDIQFRKADGTTVFVLWDESDDRLEFNTDIDMGGQNLTSVIRVSGAGTGALIVKAGTGQQLNLRDDTDQTRIAFRANAQGDMEFKDKAGTIFMLYDESDGRLEFGGAIGIVLPVKTDTGDPASPASGQLIVNEFDNNVQVYADGAWRTLASW